MFVTYEGQREAVRNALLLGGTVEIMTDNVLNAISAYKSQYVYKCHETFCPLRKSGGVNSSGSPGFATPQELELHRVRDHTNHKLYTVSYTIVGNPRFECQCGHIDYLNEDEEDQNWWEAGYVCQSRLQHLTAVEQHATVDV